MSEKSNGICVVDRTVCWQEVIAVVAGPLLPGDTRESWLYRAARKSGAAIRQIKALYYGESTDPKFSVGRKILDAADLARVAAAKKDGEQLAKIYANAAHALANDDPDSNRSSITALVEAARILGAADRA